MALILVRGESNSKLLNAIADMERHGNLNLMTKPKTLSIMQIKKIHPPAHVVVVSDEYEGYDELEALLKSSNVFQGYHSHRAKNDGMIDYTIKGKGRHIKNEKLNSYIKK